MSSFKRRTPSKPYSAPKNPADDANVVFNSPPSPSTTEPSLLSGLAALDDLLGLNGLPRGHTLLIRVPDAHSAWGPMLSRYSLAQGLVSGDAVVIIAQEDDANDLVSGCMWTNDTIENSSIDGEEVDPEIEPEGEVKIAWRYAKMKQFSTTVPQRATNQAGFNHESAAFDLTMQIPMNVIEHSRQIGQLTTIPLSQTFASDSSPCSIALQHIRKLIQEQRTESTTARRATRIVIPELGSSSWGDLQPHDVIRFLLAIRTLLRGTSAGAFITLCSTLSNDSWGGPGWAGKLSHLSDGCITFAGFGDDPTAPLAFPTHHGLVKILSSPSPGLHGGGENNLAFRCARKRLVIETMHLGAEGGVGARQTAAPPAATIQLESHSHAHPPPKLSTSDAARVSIALDNSPNTAITEEQGDTGNKIKKKSRRVVFQSDKPEIYDF